MKKVCFSISYLFFMLAFGIGAGHLLANGPVPTVLNQTALTTDSTIGVPNVDQATCTSSRSTNDSDEQQVIALTNQLRQSLGLQPLVATPALTRAAASHSDWMAATGLFQHDDVFTTLTRIAACGNANDSVHGIENIAAGNLDGQSTFLQWKNSPPHYADMTGSDAVAIGVAKSIGTFTYQGQTYTNYPFWTEEFSTTIDGPAPGPTPVPTSTPAPTAAPTPVPTAAPVVSVNVAGPTNVILNQQSTYSISQTGIASQVYYSVDFGDGTTGSWQVQSQFAHVFTATGSFVVKGYVFDSIAGKVYASSPLRVTVAQIQPTPSPAPTSSPVPTSSPTPSSIPVPSPIVHMCGIVRDGVVLPGTIPCP